VQSIRTANRAVSLKDYSDLALLVQNVGKANATAEVWTSTTLYIAPVRNVSDLDKYPGKKGSNSAVTPEWDAIKASTEEFFSDKTLIGVSLTIAPPTYVPVEIGITFTKNDQYTSEQASDEIKQTIVNSFGYAYLDFGQVITPEQIEATLNGLSSIKSARLTQLYRTGNTAARVPLIGGPGEIFVFLETDIVLTEASNESRLQGLTITNGTLSPAFNTNFYVYNFVATGNIAITATTTGAGATILVDLPSPTADIVAVSGVATSSITIAAGSTTAIPIIVTAADGTTVKSYLVTVTRAP
jgi:hypothetical protein